MSVITTPMDIRLEEPRALPPDKVVLSVGNRAWFRSSAGPETIAFVAAGLPVTRSRRSMRRLLHHIAGNRPLGATTVLAEAGAVPLPLIRAREEENEEG